MRVFLTGATGFIGRHLCERLAARGDEVLALARSPGKATALPSGVGILRGDLASLSDPATALPACDVVIHLAGVVAARRQRDYRDVNYLAVRDLLACLERQPWRPRRFLFASSLAAAGPSPAGHAWTEDDQPRPIDAYGIAKAAAEAAVRAASFPTTVFRPPVVLGPGDEASLTLFRAAQAHLGFRVAGPLQKLSFVDVRDLVDAIVRMAGDRRAGSFTYFVSHPTAIDVGQLWDELAHAIGAPVRVLPLPRWVLFAVMCLSTAASGLLRRKNQLDIKQYRQMTARAFVCSGARLTEDLGWAPRHGLRACLANAAQGYRLSGRLRPAALPSV